MTVIAVDYDGIIVTDGNWPDLADHIIRRFEGPQKRQCDHSGAHEFLAYNAFLQMLKESE